MNQKQRKDNLVTAYNLQAEKRNNSYIEDWKSKERELFLSFLQREKKLSLLEIGAGHGRDSVFFQAQGFHVTAIDLSPAMISLCLQKGVPARVMDMTTLEFSPRSFDAAYALNSFLHLSKRDFPMALENVYKVLKGGGLFYLGLYGGVDFEGIWEDNSYTPKRFFSFHTDDNLSRILASFFEIVYFQRIAFDEGARDFQSFILRKQMSGHPNPLTDH